MDRPEILGLLGRGGVGEVLRVRDPALNRIVALKALRPERLRESDQLRRFVAEAKVTARLQHPSIIPVHDFGRLEDGRPFFTMKEVQGRTLREAIIAFHNDIDMDPEDLRVNIGLRRLIEAFRRVCEAMGYAHEQGIIHRDLKPDNMMIGNWGEVLVVDWGLAICVDGSMTDVPGIPEAIEGTALYMAPELVLEPGRIASYQADVYSLGAVLYAILCGRAPYRGTAEEVLTAIVAGPPAPPLREQFTPSPELVAICLNAMARDPQERYPDAGVLGAEIALWLEQAVGTDRAARAMAQAEEMGLLVERLRASARELRDKASNRLTTVPLHAPSVHKEEAWLWEEEAERLETEAHGCEEEELQLLRTALSYAPGLEEIHTRLAALYHARHRQAEEQRDLRAVARWEVLLRAHNRGRYDNYLRGIGAITLLSEPEGAEVDLYRYEQRGRRLVPVFLRSLGKTPLRTMEIPIGSYLFRLEMPGYMPARLPLRILRGMHIRPKGPTGEERVLRLPSTQNIGPDDIFVPEGWGPGRGGERAWMDSFIVRRFPVTVREYLQFLQALWDRGLQEAVRDLMPSDGDRPLAREGNDGRLRPIEAPLESPVVLVRWDAVRAFCAWLSACTGQNWRPLKTEEYRRAALGLDGRRLPWGNFFDPSFACVRESHSGAPMRPIITAFATDESPYGLRGMTGGVREWCSSENGPVACGGSFLTPLSMIHLEEFLTLPPHTTALDLGFRVARAA